MGHFTSNSWFNHLFFLIYPILLNICKQHLKSTTTHKINHNKNPIKFYFASFYSIYLEEINFDAGKISSYEQKRILNEVQVNYTKISFSLLSFIISCEGHTTLRTLHGTVTLDCRVPTPC